MELPTIPLAIEGFLAALLSGLGTFFIARLIVPLDRNCGQLASLGFLLITLGEFLQAVGKLSFVALELPLPVLHNSRLMLLAPGFVLLAWAIWGTFNSNPGGTPVWVVPVIIIVVGCGAAAVSALSKGGTRWFFILLGMATIAQTAAGCLLAWQAWRRGFNLLAVLFVFHLATVFFQASLVRLPQQTVALQWIEQINNTLSWGVFAYAAWQLEHSIIHRRNES